MDAELMLPAADTATSPATSGDALLARLRMEYSHSRASLFQLQAELHIPPGVMILFGPSGAGKTTLLKCIAGLCGPMEGLVAVGGATLFDSAAGINLDPSRRRVAYVFQDLALFPHLTVEENTAYGLRRLPPAERERRMSKVLDSFQISHLRRRKPKEISGGEKQRVALARSLVTEPRVLLLDEPLASLDAGIKCGILDDLRAWNEERKIPILYVTHDREEALALGERIILLEKGRIVMEGAPVEVLEAPRRESLARLLGFENIFDVEIIGAHEANGTMTCRPRGSDVHLEAPLTRIPERRPVRLGVRAGDILLAAARPELLSARNILPGRIGEIRSLGASVRVSVDCGVPFVAHVTPAAVQSLGLRTGGDVWVIVKSHSCRLLTGTEAPK